MNQKFSVHSLAVFGLVLLAACGQKLGNAPSLSGGGGTSTGGTTGGSSGCSPCKIFGTAAAFSGDILVIGSADTLCANDANKPSGGSTYKAFYVDNGYRDLSNNWVLHSNTAYVRPDGTAIGTTDSSGKLPSPLTASITGVNAYFWTGMSTSWTGSGANCNDFVDGTSASSGIVGRGDLLGIGAFSATGKTCDNNYGLYCVEQ